MSNSYEKSVKRISIEMVGLFQQYDEIQITKKENKTILEIETRKFIICNQYPFRPPILYINNMLYLNYLKTNSPRVVEKIKKYNHNGNTSSICNCLYCNHILLNTNWSPTYHIEKIMNEIDKVNIVKRNIKYEIIIEEISAKRYISDYIEEKIKEYLIVTH